MHQPTKKRGKSLAAGAVAVLYIALAIYYNVTTPLWEAPDETGHFQYVVHILQQRALPRQEIGALGQAHHPPLYYLLTALVVAPVDLTDPTGMFRPNPDFFQWGQGGGDLNIALHDDAERAWPYRGWTLALFLARGFSSLLGLGTIMLTYAIGRTIFPQQRAIPLLAAMLVAFNPQFLFISASVNNDNLVTFASTGLLWQTIRLLAHDRPPTKRDGLALGGWVLAILLTKFTSLAVIGVSVLALLIRYRHGQCLKATVRAWGVALGIVIAGSFWWWLRNQLLYGDPLGLEIYRQVFAIHWRSTPLPIREWPLLFQTQFRSFWAVFGWMNIYPPQQVYRWIAFGCLAASLGWIGCGLRQRLERTEAKLLGVLFFAALAHELYSFVFGLMGNSSRWQGRYLFPAIAPIAILLATGLIGWAGRRWKPVLAGGIAVGLLALAIYMPGWVIRPAYQRAPTITEVEISYPLEVNFGQTLILRGYDLAQDPLAVTITLYWEAAQRPDFDYSVFVHLLNDQGELLGQQDHAPGSNRNHPPTTWVSKEIIADEHRIQLLRTPEGPLQMRVGVYNWANGDRLSVFEHGEAIGDFITLQMEQHSDRSLPLMLAPAVLILIVCGLACFAVRRRRL